jgi:predicted nucleotidyltransferase component of viral defense system
MYKTFLAQSKLVMDVLPFIAQEEIFALKGGTAINFFIRNLPRLSVDIDLTYCPIESRDITLKKSNEAFDRIMDKLKSRLGVHLVLQRDKKSEFISKIDIQSEQAQIKIEPNFVFRGTIYPIQEIEVQPRISEILERTVKMQVLSLEDLYAGKMCATLNRQHPRDLFDMKLLLDNEGLSEELRKAFVVYLASDSRPINELLDPNLHDFSLNYKSEFHGMTDMRVETEELMSIRDYFCLNVVSMLSDNERQFLLSLVNIEPKWDLLSLPIEIKELPSIKFKLMNLERMESKKRQKYANALEKLFTEN